MRHAKRYTNIKKRGVFLVACFTLLSTLLPAQSRVDSLIQEIEALKSAYVLELDSLWDEVHDFVGLHERPEFNKDEQGGNTLMKFRMQEYVDSICFWTIRPYPGSLGRDEAYIYHRYIFILTNQSDLGAWYMFPFMLKYFEKQSNECGIEFLVFEGTLCGYMKLRPVDLEPIIAQLAAVSEEPRRRWLRHFATYLVPY